MTLGLASAAVVATVSLGAGAAYAYWTSHGAGSGAVTTTGAGATVHVIAVTGGNDPATRLAPGGTAELVLELSNPNSFAVTISGITQNGDVTPNGGSGPGAACTGGAGGTTGVSVPSQGISVAVASGAHVVVRVPAGASMSTGSASGCQGATFEIPVTVMVQQ
jgi:hypothetical protein